MKIYDKLIKPITEVNYLRAENVERYRVIIRYFYEQYEKINYWMFKEDIFAVLKAIDRFADYTIEKCQNDLNALSEWGNLLATQDITKVSTIEDFKNKKFRYQLSEYTVEIERMTLRLENLKVEGSSLEASLLDRIQSQLMEFDVVLHKDDATIHGWWRSLNTDFIRLNQNYQDYISTLNTMKAEEMMKSRQFLIFKDKLINYLRTFVKSLQEHGLLIEAYIKRIDPADLEHIFQSIVAHEQSIPRLETEFDEQEIYDNCVGRWNSIVNWFVGVQGQNEVARLFQITNDIIRKITRYAQQISELHSLGANRKEEYRNISQIFSKCASLSQAHQMSAMIFGVERPIHIQEAIERETDSISSGVYEESPKQLSLASRTRNYKEKTTRIPYQDFAIEKLVKRQEIEAKQEHDRQILNGFVVNGKIDFSALPVINEYSRQILLRWLTKALANADKKGRTDDGRNYSIDDSKQHEAIVVRCEDGNFQMPSFAIVFEESK